MCIKSMYKPDNQNKKPNRNKPVMFRNISLTETFHNKPEIKKIKN